LPYSCLIHNQRVNAVNLETCFLVLAPGFPDHFYALLALFCGLVIQIGADVQLINTCVYFVQECVPVKPDAMESVKAAPPMPLAPSPGFEGDSSTIPRTKTGSEKFALYNVPISISFASRIF
jgi:hypothetical protein